jgi:hypothetical protein
MVTEASPIPEKVQEDKKVQEDSKVEESKKVVESSAKPIPSKPVISVHIEAQEPIISEDKLPQQSPTPSGMSTSSKRKKFN